METELKKQLTGSYCVCFNISYKEISLLVRNIKTIKSLKDVQNYFACGSKCELCCPDIQKIVDFYRKNS